MKWPSAREIVAFRPSVDAVSASLVSDDAYTNTPEDAPTRRPEPKREAASERCRRTRFDNAIRVWVAVPTFLTCLALYAGGAIESIVPLASVLIVYAACIIGAFTLFFNLGFSRSADYVLSSLDLITMSIAVYLTGATASPLYFVYFVPVVIHAFHRDWNLILFSGFGGVILYGVSVLLSLHNLSSAAMADLCARLVFMLLTVAIACLALSVLRKEEERDRLRIARLRAVSVIGNCLNRACSAGEVASMCGDVLPLMAAAVSAPDAVVEIIFSWSSMEAAQRVAAAKPPGPEVKPFREAGHGPITQFPIHLEGENAFGLISVTPPRARVLAMDDIRFLEFVGRSIALSLKRHQMIGDLRHSIEMGTAAAAVYLASGRSLRAAQGALVEGAVALVNAERAALYIWNPERERLEMNAWCGEITAGAASPAAIQSGDGLVGRAFQEGTVQPDEPPAVGARDGAGEERTAIQSLAAPLRLSDGSVIGVLAVNRKKASGGFSEDDLAIVAAFACRSAHALLVKLAIPAEKAPPSAPRLAA